MNCEVTHFAGGATLFMGKDLMVLSDWLIKWQRKITAKVQFKEYVERKPCFICGMVVS